MELSGGRPQFVRDLLFALRPIRGGILALIRRLQSLQDPLLNCYRDLRWRSRSRSDRDTFIVESRLCVQRLLESTIQVNSILMPEGTEAEALTWGNAGIPIFTLSPDQISELVGYQFHRGVLASAVRPTLRKLDDLDWSRMIRPIVLAAFGVTENENLGSMLRTAAALGVQDILLDKQSADPYSRRTVRVSMANVFKQRLYFLERPAEELVKLRQQRDVRLAVTTLAKDAANLSNWQADQRPLVLVMGNEAAGVSTQIEAIASDKLMIPMELGTDSLNVAVATGICLHYLVQSCPKIDRS